MDDVANDASCKPVENKKNDDESDNNDVPQDDDLVWNVETECNVQNKLDTHQSETPDSVDDEAHTNAKSDVLAQADKNPIKIDDNVSIDRSENNLVEHNRYNSINDKSPDNEEKFGNTDSAGIVCTEECEKTSDDKLTDENDVECVAGTRNISSDLIDTDKNNTNSVDINSMQNEDSTVIGSKTNRSTPDLDDIKIMLNDISSDKDVLESNIGDHTSESSEPKLEEKSPNNDNADLLNLLGCDDTSNQSFDTNYEYAESSNDGESTKMAEIDDVIENAIEGLGMSAASSCESDVANGQEAEENNLLEAMKEPVRSISRSYEGSLSSFRDDYDIMVNEFDGVDYDANVDISNDSNCIVSSKLDESNCHSGYHESDGGNSSISIKGLEDIHNRKETTVELDENDIEMDKNQISNQSPESETSQIDESETIAVTKDITSMDSDSFQAEAYEPLVKRIRLDIIEADNIVAELKPKPDDFPSETTSALDVDENADDESKVLVNTNANKRRANSIDQIIDDIDETRKKPKVVNNDSEIDMFNQLQAFSTEATSELQLDNEQEDEALNQKPTSFVTGNVDLKPNPKQIEKRSIPLDFLKQFRHEFAEMSRKDLEELVLSKIVEAILHKSEYSDLKHQVESQEQVIVSFRSKIQDLMKQYRDLEMVYTRLKKDLENKNASAVTPIKITRAVGLQVHLQKTNGKETNAAPATSAQSKPIEKLLPANINQTLGRKIPNQRTSTMQKQQQTQPLHQQQQQQQIQHPPHQQKQQLQLKQVQQIKQQQLLQKNMQSQNVRPQLVNAKPVAVNFATRVITTGRFF